MVITELKKVLASARKNGNQNPRWLCIGIKKILEKNDYKIEGNIKINFLRPDYTVIHPNYHYENHVTLQILINFFIDLGTKNWKSLYNYTFETNDVYKYLEKLISCFEEEAKQMTINTDNGEVHFEINEKNIGDLKQEVQKLKEEQEDIKRKIKSTDKKVSDINDKIAEAFSAFDEMICQLKIGNKEKAKENLSKLSKIFKWLGRNVLQPSVSGLIGFTIEKITK